MKWEFLVAPTQEGTWSLSHDEFVGSLLQRWPEARTGHAAHARSSVEFSLDPVSS
jgi:hypothetical protein